MDEHQTIIYGKNVVLEACRANRKIYEMLISEETYKKEGIFRKYIKDREISHQIISNKQFKQVAHQKYNLAGQLQGVIAKVVAYEYLELEALINHLSKQSKPAFLLMLDGLEDVHNLGAIMRTAESAGVDAIIIGKHASVGLNGTVARLSVGAVEYVPVVQVTNLNRATEKLKAAGIWFVGAEAENSEHYRSIDMKMPVCLVVGSEGRGISRLMKEACDFKVHIPMVGKITSLNASVAAALLLYEVHHQRHPVQEIQGGKFND